MGMGGFWCDPAPSHASLQIPPLILDPFPPGKFHLPALSLAGGCREAAGGHVASRLFPTNSTIERFQMGIAPVKPQYFAIPALQTFPQVLSPRFPENLQVPWCNVPPFPRFPPSQAPSQALFSLFFPKGNANTQQRKYLEADPGSGAKQREDGQRVTTVGGPENIGN